LKKNKIILNFNSNLRIANKKYKEKDDQTPIVHSYKTQSLAKNNPIDQNQHNQENAPG
jgi:hypothetical protein